jgi:hypothetical protein
MNSDEQARLAKWFHRLEHEWLPHWIDMPDTQFQWWNLLIRALDDATD